MDFCCPYCTVKFKVTTGYLPYLLSRFHAKSATENWSLSDPDSKLIITDPDPANNFGSDRIRIHNTVLIICLDENERDLMVEEDRAAWLQLVLVHKAEDGDVVLAANTGHTQTNSYGAEFWKHFTHGTYIPIYNNPLLKLHMTTLKDTSTT